MSKRLKNFTLFSLIGLMLSLSTAANAQIRAYRVTDRQVQTLLDRIETRANAFEDEIDRSLDRSPLDGTSSEDSINRLLGDFESSTDRLRSNFSSRRSTAADVEEVLSRAVFVNSFMLNNRVSARAQTQWSQIRTDLNALAGYYNVRSNWNAGPINPIGQPPFGQNVYYVPDNQVRTLLARIETRTDTFKTRVDRNLDRTVIDGTNREDSINSMISNFEMATDRLRDNFSARRSTAANVEEVLNRAVFVNRFVTNNRLTPAAETVWTQIRTDLNTLAGYYRVTSNWNMAVIPGTGTQFGNFDSRITGMYRLNTGQSDNVVTVVDRTLNSVNYNANQRDRMRQNLISRLAAPLTLTLEKRGQQITLASSNAQQVVFDADGTARTEVTPNGRTMRTSVTANNSDLTINYEGDRMNDFYVSFMPLSNGQLRVTRRLNLENQNQTVTAISVYDKTSQLPQWNTAGFPSNTGNYPINTGGTAVGGFIVPNNTGIVATLDTALSTRTARDGDRFSMTVTSPSQYQGAVIEGVVNGERSGVVSGSANLSLNFDTIRLRNGQTYRFGGIVDQVREPDGDVVNVNNEGTIRDGSQTTRTVTRAGIGAALGAIIGAIAGGGSGAAIGAGVGAGAGAGSVILQGRDNLELGTGSQFTITATSPANFGSR